MIAKRIDVDLPMLMKQAITGSIVICMNHSILKQRLSGLSFMLKCPKIIFGGLSTRGMNLLGDFWFHEKD